MTIRRTARVAAVGAAAVAGGTLAACVATEMTGGRWVVSTERDAMTDSATMTATLYGRTVGGEIPSVTISCTSDGRGVALAGGGFGTIVDGHAEVTVRLDTAPARPERWFVAQGGAFALAPDEQTFLRELLRARVLRARWETAGSRPRIATFDLSGFPAIRDTLRGPPCGWPL